LCGISLALHMTVFSPPIGSAIPVPAHWLLLRAPSQGAFLPFTLPLLVPYERLRCVSKFPRRCPQEVGCDDRVNGFPFSSNDDGQSFSSPFFLKEMRGVTISDPLPVSTQSRRTPRLFDRSLCTRVHFALRGHSGLPSYSPRRIFPRQVETAR